MAASEGGAEVSRESIGGALEAVLASDAFGNSKRLRRFFTFVVEKFLAGKSDEIKEYNIALAVFDREPSFNPATDTIVRVEARRLRHQLAAYYHGPGKDDPVVIDLPRGGYVPVFRARDSGPPVRRRLSFFRRPVSYGTVGLLLLVALAGVFFWYLSLGFRVPHTFSLAGSTLRVLDESGRLCWEKHLPPFDESSQALVIDKVTVADVDLDGQIEVLVNVLPAGGGGSKGGSLLCFDQAGRQRWAYRYGGTAPKTFGSRTFDPSYRGRLVRHFRMNGKPMLLTIANHYLWHPSQVSLLDAATGRMIEQYWHPGSIYHCELRDVNRDGEVEVIFAAINNSREGLGHPGVGVLTLPFSRVTPRVPDPEDPFPPPAGGGELGYALLPLPDVNRAMGMMPAPTAFKVDRDRITVEVPTPEAGGIVYDLDFQLNVLDYRFSGNFQAVHQRMYVQHLLDHALTQPENESLGKAVHFRAAPDGDNPALARFWAWR
jgi:hypothetical protein